jgi:uncharacterized protein
MAPTQSQPVNTKRDLLLRIQAHESELKLFGVRKIGLFGSFVRDEAGNHSDVDFLIDFLPEKKTFDNFMKLADFLENLTGRTVEIVTPQSLNKFTGKYILQEVEYVSLAA